MMTVCLYSFLVLLLALAETTPELLDGKCENIEVVAASINKFGFDLSKELQDNQKNLFISPLGIYFALSLAYLGSAGQTEHQLKSALHMDEISQDSDDIQDALHNLLRLIKTEQNDYSFLLANGLFLQNDYPMKQDYVDRAIGLYHATVENVDFSTDNVAVTDHINSWVSNRTNNMIPKLFQIPLSRQTVLALLNVVYFKGTWEKQFPIHKTTSGVFRNSNGKAKTVHYMRHRAEEFRFKEDYTTGYKFLELPYEGDHIVMFFVLPPENSDDDQELALSADILCSTRKQLVETLLVPVIIPKFRLTYTEDLVEPLRRLGITDLFTSEADLSLLSESNGQGFDTVLHKAVIDVNEEGTEAAAATGMIMTASVKPRFIADHSFYFYIIDNRNDLILFSGKVNDL